MGISQLKYRVEQLTATKQRHEIPDPPSDVQAFRKTGRLFLPDWAERPPTPDHAKWWRYHGLADGAWI